LRQAAADMPRATSSLRGCGCHCALHTRQHWRPGTCSKWHGMASAGAIASLLLLASLQPCIAEQLLLGTEVQLRRQCTTEHANAVRSAS
jgi:hypothetical protein